jgi:TRAP-type mannitol/chloroaromatic compound transport system substrate-binding protein
LTISARRYEACFNAAKETYVEMNAANAAFKKVHDSMMAFRADPITLVPGFNSLDCFMMGQQQKKLL